MSIIERSGRQYFTRTILFLSFPVCIAIALGASIFIWVARHNGIPFILIGLIIIGILINTRFIFIRRTHRDAQLEKIRQLYQFAEFGRLSSGLFHDLINPLTAVSLNMEKAKQAERRNSRLSKAGQYLDRACIAAEHMERFIVAIKKHLLKKGDREHFCPYQETLCVLDMLSHKSQAAHVHFIISKNTERTILGQPLHWNQIMLNLLSNAIDAYDHTSSLDTECREVHIQYTQDNNHLVCAIHDRGIGIGPNHIDKIFDPFFTTKPLSPTKGSGIGLALTKHLIEKEFNGTISVESIPQAHTTFTIRI